MLKQLTLAVLAGALLPACIINTDDSTTSISESSSSGGTTGLTSTDPTSGTTEPETTDGTTTVTPTTDGTTTDTPTTDGTTSVGTVTATDSTTDATDATTDGTTDATTGQGGGYGLCGWFAADKYYACESDGAVASLEDPEMISPIACPQGLAEGDKCDEEMGPVKGVGCCTPEGTLYYCDSEGTNSVFKQECGL